MVPRRSRHLRRRRCPGRLVPDRQPRGHRWERRGDEHPLRPRRHGHGRPGGAFFRFTPSVAGDLASTRIQVPGTARFDGGEGIDTSGDDVWFTTKGDLRVWHYRTDTDVVSVRYQAGAPNALDAVDNLWLDEASGALVVAEDGGNMELVAIRPDDSAVVIVRIPGQDGSEVTGPCFSPDGQRLYFSSQRAPVGAVGAPIGITYEVTGPFDELLGRS